MQPSVMDQFFTTTTWTQLREYADRAKFTDVVNPVDRVVYPTICKDIPEYAQQEVQEKLRSRFQSVDIKALFMRLSLKGVDAPHQAHTDSTMGKYSLMVYMNRWPDCHGGTSLVTHIGTGISSDQGLTEAGHKIWLRDTNRPERWTMTMLAGMQPNRGFIFPAHLMHRAEPVGGFGTNQRNGRLVLTAFFDTAD